MKECTILVLEDSAYNPMMVTMFNDLEQTGDYYVLTEENIKKNYIKKFLSPKVQELSKGILNPIFLKKGNLENFLEKNNKEYERIIVLFLNSSFIKTRTSFYSLNGLKKKFKNVYYVLFYIDIMNSPQSFHANYLNNKQLFDLVYTIDVNDAENGKLMLWNTPYSKIISSIDNVENDMYFCGGRKDRAPIISEILKNCKSNHISVDMDVIYGDDDIYYYNNLENMIRLHKEGNFLEYEEVLENTLKSRCILDIVQKGQNALTLRPYEAVVYNKKLLTNNESILKFKYYDARYMKYFKSVDDIDWNWIKEDKEISYLYNDVFSPIYLLNDIKSKLDE